MKVVNFTPREYQSSIVETAKKYNTMVVLPTGIGKTAIAVLLAENRLNIYPNSKIIICCPTKPLCSQHVDSFLKYTDLKEDEVQLYTGATISKLRNELWEKAKIIIATPQTIKQDIINNRISLEEVSLLCIDEAHRSRMKYANTFLTEEYTKKSKFPRILALTASPGGTLEKINDIKENLKIEAVEIRSSEDEDVKQYVQEKKVEYVPVNLPKEYEEIKNLIKIFLNSKMDKLRDYGITKRTFTKRDVLFIQFQLRKSIAKGNKKAFYAISLTAQLIKAMHALELIETQGIKQLTDYIKKLKAEETKAAKTIIEDVNFQKVIGLIEKYKETNHPKMFKLYELIQEQLTNEPESKIIVFANFRNTIDEIYNLLITNEKIKPIRLIGQKEGLSQKQQVNAIKEFGSGNFNVMIGTSVSEEGLDIPNANLAIFYESVPSEIRTIQRTGRVGRMAKGKIIFLITKNTRDESYYWSSKAKEKNMKKILYQMKEDKPVQLKLKEF
ncbi:MAG: helicase-related protein [Candidatus Nanoarchaeia archaeon]|nr:helicase-related protein [Candidatus Nanoarchaeia archaeon]